MPTQALDPDDEVDYLHGVRQAGSEVKREIKWNEKYMSLEMAKVDEIITLRGPNGNYIIRTGKKLR